MPSTIEIFCCYARKDQPLLQSLKAHLMPLQWQGLITIWSDTDINAGAEWEEEIKKHLNTAQIVLLLVSPDFMASEYCYSKELKRAMERHEQHEARIIPIVLRPTYWKGAPFDRTQMLPINAKPVTSWHNEDEALYDVVEQISTVVKDLLITRSLSEASTLSDEHHHERALVIYEQVLRLEPAYALAHLGKGETLLALGRYEESLQAYERAIQADPNVADGRIYRSKAQALSHLQRYEESLLAYDEAIARTPEQASFYREKADVLLHLQRYPQALAMYEQALRVAPTVAEYAVLVGDLLLKLGRLEQPLEQYEQALRLQPGDAELFEKKGNALFALQRYEEALAAYEDALCIEPRMEYSERKGRALLALQRYAEALAFYDQCLTPEGEHDPTPYHGKGKALFGLGRYEDTLAAYEQALRLDTTDPELDHDKGIVHEQLAQQAYEMERQLQLRSPESPRLSSGG